MVMIYHGRIRKKSSQTHPSQRVVKSMPLHPGRLTAETCPHGGLVQVIFLSKWLMAVGSSRSSSRV